MAKILVIEDERSLRNDVIDALNLASFEVLSAPDGEAGLAIARQELPDLILCDVRMPGMDGFSVLEKIRDDETTAPIPFIFMTSQSDRDSMRSGMVRGADDYITKPFAIDELLKAVDARLNRRDMFVREAESKLEDAKLRLTRMVTHELRTPLISMNTVLEIVNKRMGALSPQEMQDLVASIDSGGRRLNHLVEQMALATQVESGVLQRATLPEKGTVISLAQILNGAVGLGRRFASSRTDVTISVDPFDAEVPILCHPAPLKHAFAELLANALNVSPENGQVTFAGWRSGRAMWVTITDSGRGMTPEQIARAREGFSQVEREQHEQQGMGLGLMLAHKLIDVHGGILELHSEVGKGTQVQIGLPISPEPLQNA
ncbi:MAG: response regulator [Anaerolineae bacterium]|nr:response regulator [Anaerolineae bacterium]